MELYCTKDVSTSDLYRAERAAKMFIDGEHSRTSRYTDVETVVRFNGYGSDSHRSNRRPNTRNEYVRSTEYAATWDQWGILLSVLFDIDPDTKVGGYKRPSYNGRADFDRKTDGRFAEPGEWPEDFHGDHTFKWDGLSTKCTKCSARQIRF